MESSNLPLALERELDALGILPRMPEYTKLTPDFDPRRDMQFSMPELDENGEPPF